MYLIDTKSKKCSISRIFNRPRIKLIVGNLLDFGFDYLYLRLQYMVHQKVPKKKIEASYKTPIEKLQFA
jgi:hypothetical protein